ncbi:multidrug ABC transporter ATP-binding protein [Leptolyngbya sp. 'hensonii']|uniref:ABC transporter ATP-binding protein n=1 Tax=Leptolyngbya sp. 'hensonii' TaxID=1922337 RepID=UPI00094FEAE7|nr:ABC transporter ATP-binding protein [Leptolyngbya sp. 'hensonii']OLP18630.1 multidrug ABC transporter ATP-binding protein [Leptolyngbya sp. 'hensonii']
MSNLRSFLADKFQAVLAQLPYLPRSFALVWAAAPAWTVCWAVLLVMQGLLPVAITYLSRILVNSLVSTLQTRLGLQQTLFLVALMASLMLLAELMRGLVTWVRTAQGELVRDHISNLVHQQAARVDFAFYESAEYYDRLYRAQNDARLRPLTLLENGGSLLQNAITLIGLVLVLLPFGLWLPIVLLVSTLPAFYVVLRYSVKQHRWWVRSTPDERRSWYYNWLLTDRSNAAELRIFDLGDHFQTTYRQVREKLRLERLQLARNQSLAELGSRALALLLMGVTLAWMVWRALQGKATLGDLALFYQAFSQGQEVMRSLLQNLGQLYTNSLFLSSLFEFLTLDPQVAEPDQPRPLPLPLQEGIRFRDVTFSYPGSDRLTLQNFNLLFPARKIIAIVGNNGAGKSTLIKLICRLYDPQKGAIELDGIDLRQFALKDLRQIITVLFQEPVEYSTTAAENIALSSLMAEPNRSDIVLAAEAAGADEPIVRLPEGYDTLLGKWFGGADLSTGEWQRLALARAFLRQSPIVILDEPTSAMDSWAEADWLDRFRALVAGRMAIVITHRFTTAMRADMIHVMVAGQVIESGRHEDLLALEGHYAQSWKMQMQEIK